MNNHRHLIKTAILGAVILTLAAFGVALAAILDTTEVMSYTIDYLGVEELSNGNTLWTYALTEPTTGDHSSLSHWSLGIGECGYVIENPEIGSVYSSIITIPECGDGTYVCQVAEYIVEKDDIGTVEGFTGIKYEYFRGDALKCGSPAHTHVFQFELSTPSGDYLVGDTDVLVKAGPHYEKDYILGPVCPSSAVDLVSLDAGRNKSKSAVGVVAFLAVVLVGGGTYAYSRRQS